MFHCFKKIFNVSKKIVNVSNFFWQFLIFLRFFFLKKKFSSKFFAFLIQIYQCEKHKSNQPPQQVTTTTTAQANTQARAGALVPPSSCLAGSSHGWVPVKTHSTPVPTSVGKLGCWPALQHTTMSPRKWSAMTTWWRSKCCAISRCADHCVSMECADVPDVSNAERSGDLFNVVSRTEALRQCKLGFSTDKMVGDNKVLTARCRWYGTASVSAELQCQLRWESLRVSRRLSGQGDTDSRSWSHLWVRQRFRVEVNSKSCWSRVLECHQVRENCHLRVSCAVLTESVPWRLRAEEASAERSIVQWEQSDLREYLLLTDSNS